MRAGIRSRPWAGLDVGSFSVKLIAVQAGVGATHHWATEQVLPPAADGNRGPNPESIARAIDHCISRAGLTPRSFRGVSLGIAGTDVIVKQISLPLLDDDEVGPALRFEARKHLPFDPQSMVIDFQIIGRYASEKRLDVLLAAVSQDHLASHLAPLRLLGMDADIVDATPLALTNALARSVALEHEPLILLDIGHAASHLMLYQKGEPYFTRRLAFGGRTLTAAIAAATRVPFEEAEEWKLAAGSDQPGLRVDWTSAEMGAVLDSLRSGLVEELRRSLAFYRTIGRLGDPVLLWISGGSARLPGMAEHLAALLDSPVRLFVPFDPEREGVRADSVASGPQFTQAYGLALRTA
jgi:type IV pilus assembly protein PilM